MKTRQKKCTAPVYLLLPLLALSSILFTGSVRADTEIYLVRHAEFIKGNPAKPLSEQGNERARALVEYFKGMNVTHVYATHTDRTRDTVAPLANQRNLAVEQFPRPGSMVNGKEVTNLSKGKIAIEAMTSALKRLPDGSSVVVSANSGNIFAIIAGLGVAVSSVDKPCDPEDLSCLPCKNKSCFPKKEFHNLWKVTLSDDSAVMTRSRYGKVPLENSGYKVDDALQQVWNRDPWKTTQQLWN